MNTPLGKLTLLFGSPKFLDGGEGGIEVQGAQGVAEVDSVDSWCADEIVHVKNEVGSCKKIYLNNAFANGS